MLINKTRRSNKARFLLKYSEENSVFGDVSFTDLFNHVMVTQVGGVGVDAYFDWEGQGVGVGAYSRLGA